MIVTEKLKSLYENSFKEKVISVTPLPRSGSNRQYYRIVSENKSAIGVYNPDYKENNAFVSFTKHFLKKGLKVPQLYAEQSHEGVYLIEDLGDTTLFSLLNSKNFDDEITNYYKQALTDLIKFQIDANEGLDYSVCYPRSSFDKQSMMWDLNYFKYYFVKLTQTPFDEQLLEDDFNRFTDLLLRADTNYFMYRDFQSRNIMIKNNELYYIDYQGGRKGALQYDVASLLYDAKANIPQTIRDKLLNYYLEQLDEKFKIDKNKFIENYYGYVLMRILQALGAYGFRGIYEKKPHFLKSIPFALKNIKYLLSEKLLPEGLPELTNVLKHFINNEAFNFNYSSTGTDKLHVTINSFSYKAGEPIDYSGNGGGFVFDCRAIHNPGRYDEFKDLTGRDKAVIDFLESESDVNDFLKDVFSIVDKSIEKYIERKFTNLMISFGCTGGQHRSVYCAERLAAHLKEKYDIEVSLHHTELEKKDKS